MNVPLAVFMWFYRGLGGLGGWVLFAGGGASAAMWVLVDSARRALPVRQERVSVTAALLLSLPAAAVHFTSARGAFRQISSPYDIALYLALFGGLAAPALALWYGYRYRGMAACRYGHRPYPAEMRRCPECARRDAAARLGLPDTLHNFSDPRIHVNSPGPHADRAAAWLISPHGQRFQLFEGENTLGRGPGMAFMLVGDQAISGEHARIKAREGRYFIVDCDSQNGSWLNGRRLEPFDETELRSGDVITLSDATQVEFMAADGDAPQ